MPAVKHRKTRSDNVSGLSVSSLIQTSFEFCFNSIRKKQKEFQISVLTVFLTVAFITLIDGLGGISAVPPLQMAISMGGDFDMIIGANLGRIKTVQKPVNFFADDFDQF